MDNAILAILLVLCFKEAALSDASCVIDLQCPECLPAYMPLVVSPAGAGGVVRLAEGGGARVWCGAGGSFAAFPLARELRLTCHQGRFRVHNDTRLWHLLDLGCQENVFEDVLYPLEQCAPPLQGRAYRVQEQRGERPVAAVCFDADRATPVWATPTSPSPSARPAPAARSPRGPLSLLGNFGHMFDARLRHDAEKLFSDELRLNRRLHEILKHDHFSFADQRLSSATLLSPDYFDGQDARVTDFVSNRVATWASVAQGNWRHVQRDIAALRRRGGAGGEAVRVVGGTHGAGVALAGGRFPAPRYLWSVVWRGSRAVAVVVLNDPFVAVSAVRAAVFCRSACSELAWLQRTLRHDNYERPLYGLTFCCDVHNFTDVVTELPKQFIERIDTGPEGLLTDV